MTVKGRGYAPGRVRESGGARVRGACREFGKAPGRLVNTLICGTGGGWWGQGSAQMSISSAYPLCSARRGEGVGVKMSVPGGLKLMARVGLDKERYFHA